MSRATALYSRSCHCTTTAFHCCYSSPGVSGAASASASPPLPRTSASLRRVVLVLVLVLVPVLLHLLARLLRPHLQLLSLALHEPRRVLRQLLQSLLCRPSSPLQCALRLAATEATEESIRPGA